MHEELSEWDTKNDAHAENPLEKVLANMESPENIAWVPEFAIALIATQIQEPYDQNIIRAICLNKWDEHIHRCYFCCCLTGHRCFLSVDRVSSLCRIESSSLTLLASVLKSLWQLHHPALCLTVDSERPKNLVGHVCIGRLTSAHHMTDPIINGCICTHAMLDFDHSSSCCACPG